MVSVGTTVAEVDSWRNRGELADWCHPTPWDSAVLGVPTFELRDSSDRCLALAAAHPGHYTVKIDPLEGSRTLVDRGFYYCDTLLEPFCDRNRFRPAPNGAATLVLQPRQEEVMRLCSGVFRHGRFHRDFNVTSAQANDRYDNWLRQLLSEEKVCGLAWDGVLVGFFAADGARAVLHAVSPEVQGRGIAKYLWTTAIGWLFEQGHAEVSSSVSASNVAVLNLYCSLGFRFRNPKDVYHLLVQEGRAPTGVSSTGKHL